MMHIAVKVSKQLIGPPLIGGPFFLCQFFYFVENFSILSPRAFKSVRRPPHVFNLEFVFCNFPDNLSTFWFRGIRVIRPWRTGKTMLMAQGDRAQPADGDLYFHDGASYFHDGDRISPLGALK